MDSYSSKTPVLTIFFQLDPFNPTVGGIQTCIKYIFKYAPSAFRLQLVGITSRKSTVGKWQSAHLHGRDFDFLPLLEIADDNVRGLIPTTLKYALALRKYLKRRSIPSDFYQFHRIEPTLFTQQLSGIKLLYIHNDIYQEIKGNSQGGILWKRFPQVYFALERRLVSQFDRILSCNSQSAALYKAHYPTIADRVSYLPNTFDSDLFYPLSPDDRRQSKQALASRLQLADKTQFILFAGRLHPQKQPERLIQALALVDLPNTHLLIAGVGELETKVRYEIERLNLFNRVTLLGSLPQTELADLYRLCDLFVLTSAYEGLARSSLEALACGVPVVTTRAGETPELLTDDSGVVCENDSPGAIARSWQIVLQQPEKFPSAACTSVAAPYEASAIITKVYGKLLTAWMHSEAETQQQARRQ
ncbi:MAG: glycosyltransferase family 4 protein [Cyanobacteria bacterium P01_D01_bin.1]